MKYGLAELEVPAREFLSDFLERKLRAARRGGMAPRLGSNLQSWSSKLYSHISLTEQKWVSFSFVRSEITQL
jgi:hypothetical protein